jgi:hypothetical protein
VIVNAGISKALSLPCLLLTTVSYPRALLLELNVSLLVVIAKTNEEVFYLHELNR